MEQHFIEIEGDTASSKFNLYYFEVGAGDKTVYLQAALHANELPGTMVLHHLLPRLESLEKAGNLLARFIVVPMVNPIGLEQIEFNRHQGRYYKVDGTNFNRNWPRLFPMIKDKVAPLLGENADKNITIIRNAISEVITEQRPLKAIGKMRQAVMSLAVQADMVLDLHCDNDALLHIFTTPQCQAPMERLADYMKADGGVLTAEDSGGGSFDEVWTLLWLDANRHFTDIPIGNPCVSATLEYRGEFDVFDVLGSMDADALISFFQESDYIKKLPDFKKAEKVTKATPLNATDLIKATRSGLLAYKVELGDKVKKGDVIADLIAISGENAFIERTPLKTITDGVVISRQNDKYVFRGKPIAKVVGVRPLKERGDYLLED